MLSEEIRQKIESGLRHHPTRGSGCIAALMAVGKYRGWVCDEDLVDLAHFLEMSPEELDSVATFYNHVYRRPVGRHVILVCDSVSCWIMGYEGVRSYLTKRLGISLGETTPDGRFTVLPIQCLGVCEQAPAMMINDRLYTYLDSDKIEQALDQHP